MKKVKAFLMEEDGQGMVEYGLILGLIAVAAIATLITLGPKIKGIFDAADTKIPTVT